MWPASHPNCGEGSRRIKLSNSNKVQRSFMFMNLVMFGLSVLFYGIMIQLPELLSIKIMVLPRSDTSIQGDEGVGYLTQQSH